jgi:hypothetical protein
MVRCCLKSLLGIDKKGVWQFQTMSNNFKQCRTTPYFSPAKKQEGCIFPASFGMMKASEPGVGRGFQHDENRQFLIPDK